MLIKLDKEFKRKAQVWSIDAVVAIIIFLGALMLFYKYSINSSELQTQDIDNLLLDAKVISSYLISEGYPINWGSSDVVLIGLTDGKSRIDNEKILTFSDISILNYQLSQNLLSTINDYNVYFEDKNGDLFSIEGITSIGKDHTGDNPENIVKVVRFVFYDSQIIKMVVLVW